MRFALGAQSAVYIYILIWRPFLVYPVCEMQNLRFLCKRDQSAEVGWLGVPQQESLCLQADLNSRSPFLSSSASGKSHNFPGSCCFFLTI